jgi:DNA replication protein DnaC
VTRKDIPPGMKDFGEAIPCRCRADEKSESRRWRYANFPNTHSPKTFETFRVLPELLDSLAAAEQFVAATSGNCFLVFSGPNGTGKSHLMEATGRAMFEQGYGVRYVYVPDWLDELRATFDNSETSFDNVFGAHAAVPVLLLDDLGAEKANEWSVEKITRLIQRRLSDDSLTIITTNRNLETMYQQHGSGLADRIFDIGSHRVQVVYNRAKSYRTGEQWR